MLRIISHTDLDGVVASVLAYKSRFDPSSPEPTGVYLVGYGEVDNLILQTLRNGDDLLVLDLSPQFPATADEIDRGAYERPFLFDHHETTANRFANRPWARVDTKRCAAQVYWDWLKTGALSREAVMRTAQLESVVSLAGDRDLWINENPDGRLWDALITLCGEWGAFSRLLMNPSAMLTPSERSAAEAFLQKRDERFKRAIGSVKRERLVGGREFAFLGDGYLEFGDTSDFCGRLLDKPGETLSLVALAFKKPVGNWAVSLRSRDGVAGQVVSLLRDGRRIRGGGHGDACALYFPAHYNEDGIRDSIRSALAAEDERNAGVGVTLGDLFAALGGEEGK